MAEIARYARFQVVVFGGGKEKPRSRERRRRRIVHTVRSLPRASQPEARPPRTTRHQLAFNPPASRRQQDPKQPAADPPPSPTRPPKQPATNATPLPAKKACRLGVPSSAARLLV